MDFGTSYGLAFASGVNAYLPLLSFAIAARWFHPYKVNPDFQFITQDWFIIVLVILAIADLVADKIPGVDHVWDATHTVIRPIAGAIVAAASANVSGAGLPVTLVLGGTLAGMTHTTKAATRIACTTTTAGLLNTVISIVEDIIVVITILLSLFTPYVMLIVIAIFVLLFLIFMRRIFRALSRRRQKAQAGV